MGNREKPTESMQTIFNASISFQWNLTKLNEFMYLFAAIEHSPFNLLAAEYEPNHLYGIFNRSMIYSVR